MNQFFEVTRFSLLVRQHWAYHKKRYGLSVLAFMGVVVIYLLSNYYINKNNPASETAQQLIYIFFLFIAGTLHTGQYFRDLDEGPRGINFLMVPASTFEKWLCSLLYTIVLFFIVFTAAFYLIDSIMIYLFNIISGEQKAKVANVFPMPFVTFRDGTQLHMYLFYFFVQSIFLFGAVYFGKYSFIKTLITSFVLYFVFIAALIFIYDHLIASPADVPAMGGKGVFVSIILLGIVTPCFWIITYFRLKLKQV